MDFSIICFYLQRYRKEETRINGDFLNRWFKSNGIDKRCEVSGCSSPKEKLEVHHIKPVSLGGKDEISNMVSLCWEHHSGCDHNSIGRVDENGYLIQGNIKVKLLKSAIERIKAK